MRKQRGFTLIELLIVVAIIGIIAAIAIPNLLSAIQRGKQKRAMGEVRSIATASQAYATDTNQFSPQATGAITNSSSAGADLAPDYIKSIPISDPWTSSYQYYGTSTGFGCSSWGKDKAVDVTLDDNLLSTTVITNTTCFECDVVWANDTFIAKPEGKQKICQ